MRRLLIYFWLLSGLVLVFNDVLFGLDTTPPVIFNVNAINISNTTARLVWYTDEPANSGCCYGTSNSSGIPILYGGYVNYHSILLTGLTPGTLYHFKVISFDSSLNKSESPYFTFTTKSPENIPLEII